jgi:hypothetical protein
MAAPRKTVLDKIRENERRNGHTEGINYPYPEGQGGNDREVPPAQEVQLDEIDAADLANEGDGAELDFIPLLGRADYIVRGWSHVLAGYPRCGKTDLLAACIPSWLARGDTILYLTEEPRSIWRYRLANSLGPWRGMRLVFGLGVEPLELMVRIQHGTETIIVIDTVRNLGILPRDENDNAAIARALAPWVAIARKKEATLIFVHHDRKGGGDHGEAIAGGHAFLGAVDIALEVTRDKQANRRVIKMLARLIQSDELLYERDEQSRCMIVLGDPASVRLAEVRRTVLEVVDVEWLTTAQLYDRLDDPKPAAEQMRRALLAEVEAGNLLRDPAPLSEGCGQKGTLVLGKKRLRAIGNLTSHDLPLGGWLWAKRLEFFSQLRSKGMKNPCYLLTLVAVPAAKGAIENQFKKVLKAIGWRHFRCRDYRQLPAEGGQAKKRCAERGRQAPIST